MSTATSSPSEWDWTQPQPPATQPGANTSARSVTGGDLEQEPVVVWEAANPLEAQVVKGRLESEGIPAIIQGEALGNVYGLTVGNLAQTDVLVPAALADKATEILETEIEWMEDDDFGPDDFGPDDFKIDGSGH
jgi:hypothetical protein